MDRKPADAGGADLIQKIWQDILRQLVIHPDPAFDRYIDRDCLAHGGRTIGHKFGGFHQYSPKAARLHPIRRAANIEVDLIIARRGAKPRRRRQLFGIRAAKLQRHGMFLSGMVQQMQRPTPHQSRRSHHFRIKQGFA